jgi:plastocyanin
MKKAALAVLIAVLGACAAQGASATEVGLDEFWVAPAIDILEAGSVDLSVENYGEFPHTLVISDSSGTVIAATDLVTPGEETELTITLEPGTYMFTCRIVNGLDDGSVIDHYQEGMVASVEVVASAG